MVLQRQTYRYLRKLDLNFFRPLRARNVDPRSIYQENYINLNHRNQSVGWEISSISKPRTTDEVYYPS